MSTPQLDAEDMKLLEKPIRDILQRVHDDAVKETHDPELGYSEIPLHKLLELVSESNQRAREKERVGRAVEIMSACKLAVQMERERNALNNWKAQECKRILIGGFGLSNDMRFKAIAMVIHSLVIIKLSEYPKEFQALTQSEHKESV